MLRALTRKEILLKYNHLFHPMLRALTRKEILLKYNHLFHPMTDLLIYPPHIYIRIST